mmetsp:Transcript_18673/g.43190  ORF Transcript_18673/g.43190 Transcript_18673/m.43190 type:complete len:451 (+) Transcript_18673:579-1931(+)
MGRGRRVAPEPGTALPVVEGLRQLPRQGPAQPTDLHVLRHDPVHRHALRDDRGERRLRAHDDQPAHRTVLRDPAQVRRPRHEPDRQRKPVVPLVHAHGASRRAGALLRQHAGPVLHRGRRREGPRLGQRLGLLRHSRRRREHHQRDLPSRLHQRGRLGGHLRPDRGLHGRHLPQLGPAVPEDGRRRPIPPLLRPPVAGDGHHRQLPPRVHPLRRQLHAPRRLPLRLLHRLRLHRAARLELLRDPGDRRRRSVVRPGGSVPPVLRADRERHRHHGDDHRSGALGRFHQPLSIVPVHLVRSLPAVVGRQVVVLRRLRRRHGRHLPVDRRERTVRAGRRPMSQRRRRGDPHRRPSDLRQGGAPTVAPAAVPEQLRRGLRSSSVTSDNDDDGGEQQEDALPPRTTTTTTKRSRSGSGAGENPSDGGGGSPKELRLPVSLRAPRSSNNNKQQQQQ